jgi:hypothetical protein
LSGKERGNGGTATINFDNGPVLISYDGGSFDLTVPDITVNAGEADPKLMGTLSDLTVPEPASLGLLVTGVLGFAGVFRRKLGL